MKEISSSLKLILCCLILTGSLSGEARLFAQEIGCYQNLAFKDFLAAKVENDTDFVRAVYSNIQFPVEARKIEAQAIIEVLLINHNMFTIQEYIVPEIEHHK